MYCLTLLLLLLLRLKLKSVKGKPYLASVTDEMSRVLKLVLLNESAAKSSCCCSIANMRSALAI